MLMTGENYRIRLERIDIGLERGRQNPLAIPVQVGGRGNGVDGMVPFVNRFDFCEEKFRFHNTILCVAFVISKYE